MWTVTITGEDEVTEELGTGCMADAIVAAQECLRADRVAHVVVRDPSGAMVTWGTRGLRDSPWTSGAPLAFPAFPCALEAA